VNPHQPDVVRNLRSELSLGRHWLDRGIVLACAALAGLFVVGFTVLTEWTERAFGLVRAAGAWWPLLWTPLVAAGVVWLTRRYAPGAAGSGIPQVMAAMDVAMPPERRGEFVSLKLSVAKMLLTAGGLLGGLSIGREGPAVQVAAGVMHHARRWLSPNSGIRPQDLLAAGGAAGIAAAFNTPLAGVVFAIEELTRGREYRNTSLVVACIVLAGLMAVSVFGNNTYFGRLQVQRLEWNLLGPGLLVALVSGLAGGLFSRLIALSMRGMPDRVSMLRARRPIVFAAACGFVVAVIGIATGGAVFGAGYHPTSQLLGGDDSGSLPVIYTLLKFIATWLSTWAGVPGGIFAPSLAIGAGIGHDVAYLLGVAGTIPLIALGMVGFLAAVTQAPLTAFIIVMEMVDGHAMVLSLMATALLASGVSRLVSKTLYSTLTELLLMRFQPPADEQPSRP
jgi:H+/Cl- antiporter ClcA